MKQILNKQRFSFLVLGMMLVSLLIAVSPVQASVTTEYYELFSGEATNAVPVSNATEGAWYTFAKSGFAYAAVNGSDRFLINDSTSPPAAGYANFTFASLPTAQSAFDVSHYTSFYYTVSYRNDPTPKTTKHNHSGAAFMLNGNSVTICTVYVYGTNATAAGDKNRIVITNYSGAKKVNATVKTGYEYGIAYSPDYNANTIAIRLYNESAGGTIMNTTTITLQGQTNLASLKIKNYPASSKVFIAVDDMDIVKNVPNYTTFNSMEQMIVIVAVPALLFVAILAFVISGNITTPEAIVSLIVIFLLAMVTLAFILS